MMFTRMMIIHNDDDTLVPNNFSVNEIMRNTSQCRNHLKINNNNNLIRYEYVERNLLQKKQ